MRLGETAAGCGDFLAVFVCRNHRFHGVISVDLLKGEVVDGFGEVGGEEANCRIALPLSAMRGRGGRTIENPGIAIEPTPFQHPPSCMNQCPR